MHECMNMFTYDLSLLYVLPSFSLLIVFISSAMCVSVSARRSFAGPEVGRPCTDDRYARSRTLTMISFISL